MVYLRWRQRGWDRALSEPMKRGYFWFFDPANVELAVKVLDGRPINGKFWGVLRRVVRRGV